jgi:hypothetical protein
MEGIINDIAAAATGYNLEISELERLVLWIIRKTKKANPCSLGRSAL